MQVTPEQEKGKTRTDSGAEETSTQAEEDKRRSFLCRVAGNIIIGIALLIYTIVVWVEFADKTKNRTTLVKTQVVSKIEFPSIFFEMSEYGQLVDVQISYYRKTCDLKSASNPTQLNPKILINPTSQQIMDHELDWIILNSSLSYYNYSGYGDYTFTYNASNYESSTNGSRRLLSSPSTTLESNTSSEGNTSYADSYDYFSTYNVSSYLHSSASNIYYILPPTKSNKYLAYTNTYTHCGDLFEVFFRTSVPKGAFKNLQLTDKFELSLYVRSYPDSFGIQYGYDSRAAVYDSYTNKHHIYFTGKLGFGQVKNEDIQLTISKDKVDHETDFFYQSVASIDLTNLASNTTFIEDESFIFQNYLYITCNDLVIKYDTVQDQTWTQIISGIGGMYLTLSAPVLIIIAMYLYGFKIGSYNFDGKAPLDPLPEDMLKRLDGYLAKKIIDKQLHPGVEWLKRTTADTYAD